MNRPDPARPGPTGPDPDRPWRSLTSYFSNVFKYTSLKLSYNTDSGLKIVVSNFHRDFFNSSEVRAFFTKTIFFSIFTYNFAYNSRTTKYFQNLNISRERTFEDIIDPLYVFLISLIRYKIDFLCQINRFSHEFFRILGWGRDYYKLFMPNKLKYKFSSKK